MLGGVPTAGGIALDMAIYSDLLEKKYTPP